MEVWREYQLAKDIHVMAKRCQSSSSKRRFVSDVVVGVWRDATKVKIWLNQGEPIQSVLLDPPQRVLGYDEITPGELSEWVMWEEATRIIEFSQGLPFCELYPSSWYAEAIINRLHLAKLPGWVYCTITNRAIALIKDFDCFADGCLRCVELTDTGVSLYKSSLGEGCGFSSGERILFLDTGLLTMHETLKNTSCHAHAEEILSVHRRLRHWIFSAAASSL
jgi:hypothetical protein